MSRRQPWMKWYPADWRADPALRMCSIGARGLWIEMLCVMHEADPYGSLLINGTVVSEQQLATLAGIPPRQVAALLAELRAAGVFSEDDGIIFSRRMRRDAENAERDKANGKAGGNPTLKAGVNPPDKAQKPDTRSQKEDAAGAAPETFHGKPPDPDADLFRRGREVLGREAGGLVARVKRAKNGSVPLTRAAIETAATKDNPREYLGRIVSGAAADADPNSPAAWPSGIPGVT
jgi:hypothetical protein